LRRRWRPSCRSGSPRGLLDAVAVEIGVGLGVRELLGDLVAQPVDDVDAGSVDELLSDLRLGLDLVQLAPEVAQLRQSVSPLVSTSPTHSAACVVAVDRLLEGIALDLHRCVPSR
jgi:hypothetical protein